MKLSTLFCGTGLTAVLLFFGAAVWLLNNSHCPRCGAALEILPHLRGPVTPDGYRDQLAGVVVNAGTCIASPHVLVCRACRRYREPDAWTWRPLPRDFDTIAPK